MGCATLLTMTHQPPNRTPSPARRAMVRGRHGALLGMLRAFDAWMGLSDNWRERISISVLILTAVSTIMGFFMLLVLVLRGIWLGLHPFFKPYLAEDSLVSAAVVLSALALVAFWKGMTHVMDREFKLLHPDNQQERINRATDPLLRQRCDRFHRTVSMCSPLEWKLAQWLWQQERVGGAKAALLDAQLSETPLKAATERRARL